jgi:protein TonB
MDQFDAREPVQVQPIYPYRLPHDYFGRMIVISLALHAIFSFILLTPRQSDFKGSSVNYLELKDISVQEPATSAVLRQPDPEEDTPEEPHESPDRSTTTMTETEKLQKDVKQLLTDSSSTPERLHEKSFGLGLINGYFSSLAEGETLRTDIKDYYFSILREINEKWWLSNEGGRGSLRGAVVEIVIARSGMIVSKTLIRSSGNPAFDRSIFATLEKANPLPPLPQDYQMKYFSAPIRFIAPLNFFAS